MLKLSPLFTRPCFLGLTNQVNYNEYSISNWLPIMDWRWFGLNHVMSSVKVIHSALYFESNGDYALMATGFTLGCNTLCNLSWKFRFIPHFELDMNTQFEWGAFTFQFFAGAQRHAISCSMIVYKCFSDAAIVTQSARFTRGERYSNKGGYLCCLHDGRTPKRSLSLDLQGTLITITYHLNTISVEFPKLITIYDHALHTHTHPPTHQTR